MNNPQRTIDLKKVQWCDYYWINGKGDTRRTKPQFDTVNDSPVSNVAIAYPLLQESPHETMLERAKRLGILDVWKPVCRIHITANRCLTYTGEKATKFWQAYNAHIYKKK